MKCKNCNKEINFEDKFCTGCGYRVGNENLKINKKIESKKVLKARQIVSNNFLATLIIICLIGNLFFENYLKGFPILTYLWYIITPITGAILVKITGFDKLYECVDQNNYRKIIVYSVIDLLILGFLYVGSNYGLKLLIIPVILAYLFSATYLMFELLKVIKNIKLWKNN